jgi:hypothetical protein
VEPQVHSLALSAQFFELTEIVTALALIRARKRRKKRGKAPRSGSRENIRRPVRPCDANQVNVGEELQHRFVDNTRFRPCAQQQQQAAVQNSPSF